MKSLPPPLCGRYMYELPYLVGVEGQGARVVAVSKQRSSFGNFVRGRQTRLPNGGRADREKMQLGGDCLPAYWNDAMLNTRVRPRVGCQSRRRTRQRGNFPTNYCHLAGKVFTEGVLKETGCPT